MPVAAAALLVVIAGYLLGSIPVAVLVARRRAGFDLRERGDRNPGFWNAKEQLGVRAAVPVFAGDTAKGVAAGVVWAATGTPWWVGYLAVGAAMVGHAWPVFAGFRGGRSILTFAGGMLVLAPLAGAVAVAACVLVSLVARSFAVGARVGVFGFPAIQLLVERAWPPYRVAATGALMTLIGLRFLTAGRSDRATPSSGAAPTA